MFRSLGPIRPSPHPHLPKVCRWGKVLKFLSVPWPQAENIKQKSPNWQSVKYAKTIHSHSLEYRHLMYLCTSPSLN